MDEQDEQALNKMVAEAREKYGDMACRVAAAYISYCAGNALQTEYKKMDRARIGTAWLIIAQQMLKLGPAETAERLIDSPEPEKH